MEKRYEVKLWLYESSIMPTNIQYVMNDRETMPLHIRLLGRDREFEIPVGSVVEMNFQQQGGVRFLRMAEVEDCYEGKVVYNMAAGDISMPGDVTASVTIVTGDKRLTWQEFRFRIVRGLNEGQAEPPNAIEPWQNSLTARLSEQETRILSIEETVSADRDRFLPTFELHINAEGELVATTEGADVPLKIDKDGYLIYLEE